MFEDKIESRDLEKMPSEYRDLLGRVLTIQADCEIGGPHLYVKEMLLNAPSKLNQLMVARTTAEEMDHYRKIARLAGEIGVETSFLLNIPNQKRYLEAFRGTIETWEDYAVFGFLIDRVGRYQLEEFLDCSYLPLQRVLTARRIHFDTDSQGRLEIFGQSGSDGGNLERIQIQRVVLA